MSCQSLRDLEKYVRNLPVTNFDKGILEAVIFDLNKKITELEELREYKKQMEISRFR
jgi:hypothetical protein